MKNSYKILILSTLFAAAIACGDSSGDDSDDDFLDQSPSSSVEQPADSTFSLTYDGVSYSQSGTSKQYAIAYYDSSSSKVGLSALQCDQYGKPYFKLIIHFDNSSMPTGAINKSSTVILQVKSSTDHNKAWKTYRTTATLDFNFPASIDRTTPTTITINDPISIGGATLNTGSTYAVLLGSLN